MAAPAAVRGLMFKRLPQSDQIAILEQATKEERERYWRYTSAKTKIQNTVEQGSSAADVTIKSLMSHKDANYRASVRRQKKNGRTTAIRSAATIPHER
jgi:hypothetical protein